MSDLGSAIGDPVNLDDFETVVTDESSKKIENGLKEMIHSLSEEERKKSNLNKYLRYIATAQEIARESQRNLSSALDEIKCLQKKVIDLQAKVLDYSKQIETLRNEQIDMINFIKKSASLTKIMHNISKGDESCNFSYLELSELINHIKKDVDKNTSDLIYAVNDLVYTAEDIKNIEQKNTSNLESCVQKKIKDFNDIIRRFDNLSLLLGSKNEKIKKNQFLK